MLTLLAARKAQLQRVLSVIPPNSLRKPFGSAVVKGGERKPSHHLERDESPNIKGTKNLDHSLHTNAFIVADEARETASGLPAPTYTAAPLLSQAASPTSSRTTHYRKAEEALTAALKGSQHIKPTDLQIDALRQAMSILNTRISDAADQLEKINI